MMMPDSKTHLLTSAWGLGTSCQARQTCIRQNVSPMHHGASLGCTFLAHVRLSQAPARGKGVSLVLFGIEHAAQPGCSGPASRGEMGSKKQLKQPGHLLSICLPDAGKPSGTAGLRETQRTDPSVSTGPALQPQGGAGTAFLEGSSLTSLKEKAALPSQECPLLRTLPGEMIRVVAGDKPGFACD